MASPAAAETRPPKRWPWRKNITPLETLQQHTYPGKGTEESPYSVDWIPSIAVNSAGKVDENGEPLIEVQVKDLEYPQNWKAGYRWGVVAIGALSVLSVTMTSSMMSAAVFDIRRHFPGHTDEMYIMVTSIFVLGFVVGPLVWAPASEIFGRRRMFIATFIPFTIFNAACCGSNSLETLLAFRFLAGLFGSSSLTSVGGIITDMFPPAERASAMGIFAVAPFLGPAIGPVAAGFLAEARNSSWKWVAALLAFFSAILTVAGALWLPETYEPVLLRRRAERLTKVNGGKWAYHGDVEKPLQMKELFLNQLKTPWKLLFTEPIALLMALYISVVYAILYMQFTSFPIVFVQQRGWSPAIGGLAFIGLSVGSILGLVLLGTMNKRYAKKLDQMNGFLPPEERLPMVILGGILLPVGLFMFAWTSPPNIHWIVPLIATVIFGAALVGLFLGIMSYLVDTYTLYSASALAGNTVMRSIFGVCFPLFTVRMYNNLGVEWAGTVVGFIALAFIPAPILFYKFGQRIRMSSKYAREADAAARIMAEKFQRAKMVGSQAASRVASGTNLPSTSATGTGSATPRAMTGSATRTPTGTGNGQVDVEKIGEAVNEAFEGGKVQRRGSILGGQADSMAIPAVVEGRAGTRTDVVEEKKE